MTFPHLPAPLSRTQVFAELSHAGWSFTETSRGAEKNGHDDAGGTGEKQLRPPPSSALSSSSFSVRAPPRGPRASAPSAFPFGRDDGRRLAAPWLPSSYARPAGPEAACEALSSAAGAVAAARLSAVALGGDARWCRAAAEDLGRIAALVRAAASSEASGAWVKCFERHGGEEAVAGGGGGSGKNKKKKKKSAAAAAAAARSASRALTDVSTAMAAAAKAVRRACAAPRATARKSAGAGGAGAGGGEEGEGGGGDAGRGPLPPPRFRLPAAAVLDCVVALDAAFFSLWEHFVCCPWDCPATVPAPHAYFPFVASKSSSAAASWRALAAGPGRAAAPAWARAWGLDLGGGKGGGGAGGGSTGEAAAAAAAAEALAAAVEATLAAASTPPSSAPTATSSSTHPLLRLIHARAAEGASLLWASGLVGAAGGGGAGGARGGAEGGAAAAAAAASREGEQRKGRRGRKGKRRAPPSPQSSCTSSDSDAVSSSSSSDSDTASGSSGSDGGGKSSSSSGDGSDDAADADGENAAAAAAAAPTSFFAARCLPLDANATQPWPATASLTAWRSSARECHSYAYAVPTRSAIRKMLSFAHRSCASSAAPSWVEVGAGVGFWAAAMREELSGTPSASRVLAVDVAAQRRKHGEIGGGGGGGGGSRGRGGSGASNQWHGRVPAVTDVEPGGPEVLISSAAASPPSLLLCYPPPDGAMACTALAAATPAGGGGGGGEGGEGGEGEMEDEGEGEEKKARSPPSAVVAVVGEVAGDTGGRSFWRELSSSSALGSSSSRSIGSSSGWRCVLRERLPDWSDTAAELLIFRFFSASKRGSERDNEMERGNSLPLVACSCCGSSPATRRCRHCRSHALCDGCSGDGDGDGAAGDRGGRGEASRQTHAAEHALRLLPAPEALEGGSSFSSSSSSLWEALPAFLWKRSAENEGGGKGSKKEKEKPEKKRKK